MNLADILIILCFIAFLIRGVELGLIQQVFSTSGFIGGMLLGGLLQHHFIQDMASENSRAMFSILVVLGTALIFLFIGELIGGALRMRLHAIDNRWLSRADKAGGSAIAGATLLVFVWLISGLAGSVPDKAVQNEIKDSRIIQHINAVLPDAPKTLSRIGTFINPNGFPRVFVGREPALDTTTPIPDVGDLQAGVEAARPSVVKVFGKGCENIATGSGFIAGRGMVITNAHVVAGVRQPQITDTNGTHDARVIWFDPDLDVAILASEQVTGRPLPMLAQTAPTGTLSAALGFPGGGSFSVSPAMILDSFTATGRNIYDQGTTERSVYSLRSDINPGNSGGPLINTEGAVIGVIFAKSSTYDQVGYALTMSQIIRDFNQTQAGSRQAVSTGGCSTR